MAKGKVPTGIDDETFRELKAILYCFPHVREAVIFGSRAKGCYQERSDIDIAVKGEEVTENELASMLAYFEASNIPYFVDVVSYDHLRNIDLKEHIDRVCIPFYWREESITFYILT